MVGGLLVSGCVAAWEHPVIMYVRSFPCLITPTLPVMEQQAFLSAF
jgi:hypothetical protein